MASFESGREFLRDPVTAQLFYREPADGGLTAWAPLPPSDYHLQRPESHNVGVFIRALLSVLIFTHTDVDFSAQWSGVGCESSS